MENPLVNPGDRILRLPQVCDVTGKCRSSIYSDNTFPKPLKIGPRASGWLESEVLSWLAQQAAKRPVRLERDRVAAA